MPYFGASIAYLSFTWISWEESSVFRLLTEGGFILFSPKNAVRSRASAADALYYVSTLPASFSAESPSGWQDALLQGRWLHRHSRSDWTGADRTPRSIVYSASDTVHIHVMIWLNAISGYLPFVVRAAVLQFYLFLTLSLNIYLTFTSTCLSDKKKRSYFSSEGSVTLTFCCTFQVWQWADTLLFNLRGSFLFSKTCFKISL